MGSNRASVNVRACLFVLAGMAAPVQGQFTFTQQTRRVFAHAWADNFGGGGSQMQQEFVAPDFGPFNGTATAGAGGTVGASGDGRAEQVSSLLPGVISANGLMRVGGGTGSAGTMGGGDAAWDFIVSFSVSDPTPVQFAWSMQAVPLVGSSVGELEGLLEFKRDTASGPVLVLGGQISPLTTSYGFAEPLVLEPGVHTVTLHVWGRMQHPNFSYRQAQTNIGLTITAVPGPASVLGVGCGFAMLLFPKRRTRSRPAGVVHGHPAANAVWKQPKS